jgi:hypothetical protein
MHMRVCMCVCGSRDAEWYYGDTGSGYQRRRAGLPKWWLQYYECMPEHCVDCMRSVKPHIAVVYAELSLSDW